MAIVINTNTASIGAQRSLNKSVTALGTSLQRLSSGLRINSAKDDAAGLAISEKMRAQIGGLAQASRNAQDGISLTQTTEGALVQVEEMLQRMRELAVQSANDTNNPADRSFLQQELAALTTEISRIANTTEFNGKKVLDATFTAQKFQIGANQGQTLSITMSGARASDFGNNTVSGGAASAGAAGGVAVAAGATFALAANAVASQTLTISGNLGSTTAAIGAASSAKTIAAAVNAVTSSTGVAAIASTTATLSSLSAAGTVTFNLYGLNTAAVPISASVASTTDLSPLATAINATTASTGITASVDAGTITLTSAEGYDIGIEGVLNAGTATIAFAGATAGAVTLGGAVGTDSSRAVGGVSFSSSNSFSVATDIGSTLLSASSISSSLSSVASINIGTQSGAATAISTIDGAIGYINTQRATIGATQNRLNFTSANLATSLENAVASLSQIFDADIAEEMMTFTKSQVLQQAGIAMLAQANAAPQNVLALLK